MGCSEQAAERPLLSSPLALPPPEVSLLCASIYSFGHENLALRATGRRISHLHSVEAGVKKCFPTSSWNGTHLLAFWRVM